jgi:hypothetical protein
VNPLALSAAAEKLQKAMTCAPCSHAPPLSCTRHAEVQD